MSQLTPVNVPDIGDVSDVDVIELQVAVGDTINKEDPLITLETDKATMDVPSSQAGVVKAIHVAVGDKVSEGSLILEIEAGAADSASVESSPQATETVETASAAAEVSQPEPASAVQTLVMPVTLTSLKY